MEIHNPSPGLYNEDLAPAKERNWGAFSIFNVWTSDVHSLWGYYLAASLFLLCGNFVNFLIAIGLSWGLARSITRPIVNMVSVLRKLAAHDHSFEIPDTSRRDEIGHEHELPKTS